MHLARRTYDLKMGMQVFADRLRVAGIERRDVIVSNSGIFSVLGQDKTGLNFGNPYIFVHGLFLLMLL